mmetsp:Transcript_24830/g.54532  ORF Transcript_24830/g.54532 Transcript_24830/m.54532 type:complete len:205 (+) Transcript_24830:2983-3597(+)
MTALAASKGLISETDFFISLIVASAGLLMTAAIAPPNIPPTKLTRSDNWISSCAAGNCWYRYCVTAVKMENFAMAKGTSFSKRGGAALKSDHMLSSFTILFVTSKIFFPNSGWATDRIRTDSNGTKTNVPKKEATDADTKTIWISKLAACGPAEITRYRLISSVSEYENPPQKKNPTNVGIQPLKNPVGPLSSTIFLKEDIGPG